jgi:cytochrome b
MRQRMLVWDVPTRVFHWLLVVSFAGAFLTAESERYRDIHVLLGYTLLGLIAVRMLWGLIGTRYARFRSFLFKPSEIAAYVRSLLKARPEHYVGHNPAGSVAVFALLGLGIASGVSGVLIFQDVGGDILEELHDLVSYAMLAVVVVHVAGVLISSVMHRENLVRAMITGFKSARPDQGIRRAHGWLGVIMLAAAVTFWSVYPTSGLMTWNNGVAQAQQDSDRD